MRIKQDIKSDLLTALGSIGDEAFGAMGFKRRKGSLDYRRTVGDAQQTVAFAADYLPKCKPGEELHLHPAMRLVMPTVTEAALRLVAGKKVLLANAPSIIVNQPIEFTAPKAEHVRWFATGLDQMKERVTELIEFVEKWVRPFLDQLSTPDDLIAVYKSGDERMLKQRHWYLFIAAAYMVNGDDSEALNILENNLGLPGLRKRYAVAFETLGPA